ncbi:hypothetical protein F5X97DRAFT_346572 [Nemania serpens]|nr:hypothetical protein F5X97DRAFT_346572 [Nemania serpens]
MSPTTTSTSTSTPSSSSSSSSASALPTSPSSPPSSPSLSPTIRRPDTGCAATLSAGLAPLRVSHAPRGCCKCICAAEEGQQDEQEAIIARLASSVRVALEEGILVSEKPALCFAMLLLGADVVY